MAGLNKEQFKDLHKQMMATPGEEGGFSVHAVTGDQPAEGYMVSLPDTEEPTFPASATKASQLARYVNRNRESLSQPDVFFGGWKPETDAYTTLDRSQQIRANPATVRDYGSGVADIDAATTALDLGIARKQDSIYSVKRGRSTYTNVVRKT